MAPGTINGMGSRVSGSPVCIPPGVNYATSPSALVQVHGDLYADAAKVVSVGPGGRCCVKVVWQEHAKQASAHIIQAATADEARELARAIMERVNAGRMPQAPAPSPLTKDEAAAYRDDCDETARDAGSVAELIDNRKVCEKMIAEARIEMAAMDREIERRRTAKMAAMDREIERRRTAKADCVDASAYAFSHGMLDGQGRSIPKTNKGLFEFDELGRSKSAREHTIKEVLALRAQLGCPIGGFIGQTSTELASYKRHETSLEELSDRAYQEEMRTLTPRDPNHAALVGKHLHSRFPHLWDKDGHEIPCSPTLPRFAGLAALGNEIGFQKEKAIMEAFLGVKFCACGCVEGERHNLNCGEHIRRMREDGEASQDAQGNWIEPEKLTSNAAAITHIDRPPADDTPDPYAVGEPVRLKTGGQVMTVESTLGTTDELRCRWTKPSGLTERGTFRRDALEPAASAGN